ncbi:MAG: hypothetical protein ACPGN3_13320, partial [Opitutales bacterium]
GALSPANYWCILTANRQSALVVFIPIILISLFSGCASVTRGTMDVLEVRSEPPGAKVEVTRKGVAFDKKEIEQNNLAKGGSRAFGPLVATTPAAFNLKREGNYEVVISKTGYETLTVDVTHKTAGAGGAGMAGNIILGGVIGAAIDANSGATQDLTPNPIVVNLERNGASVDSEVTQEATTDKEKKKQLELLKSIFEQGQITEDQYKAKEAEILAE